MSKESNFLIYCMERYRHFKGLSGADVAKTFEEYGIYGYITKYFESFKTKNLRRLLTSCRILTIILAASQATTGSRRNCLYDIPQRAESIK